MDKPKDQMYFNVQGNYYLQVASHANNAGITMHQALEELIDLGYQYLVNKEITELESDDRTERLMRQLDTVDELVDSILKKLSIAKL